LPNDSLSVDAGYSVKCVCACTLPTEVPDTKSSADPLPTVVMIAVPPFWLTKLVAP
jgi:hypothetical protein